MQALVYFAHSLRRRIYPWAFHLSSPCGFSGEHPTMEWVPNVYVIQPWCENSARWCKTDVALFRDFARSHGGVSRVRTREKIRRKIIEQARTAALPTIVLRVAIWKTECCSTIAISQFRSLRWRLITRVQRTLSISGEELCSFKVEVLLAYFACFLRKGVPTHATVIAVYISLSMYRRFEMVWRRCLSVQCLSVFQQLYESTPATVIWQWLLTASAA